jgi:hypothetical protein
MFSLAWKRFVPRIPEMFTIFTSAKSAVHRVGFALENRLSSLVRLSPTRKSGIGESILTNAAAVAAFS